MEIGNRTEATMQATQAISATTTDTRPTHVLGLQRRATRTLRRLQAAIVSGSNHPCWRPNDPATSVRDFERRPR
jgi:hypothetical protein